MNKLLNLLNNLLGSTKGKTGHTRLIILLIAFFMLVGSIELVGTETPSEALQMLKEVSKVITSME